MNYGILNNRRPAKSSPGEVHNPLLSDVRMREMAKQMGLEPKDFGREAMELWKTLDTMAENDPKAYQHFISDQLKDGPPGFDADAPKPLRAFNPKPGYVVKCGMLGPVKQQMVEIKLFLNLCFHDIIDLPKNPNSNRDVPLDTRAVPTTNNLQIPLAIGSLREIRDINGSACRVIDAVFNPWVRDRCKWDTNFKRDIMTLAITWVQQDAKITLTSRAGRFIKSVYKGGVAVGGEIITARFPIVPEQQQSRPIVKLYESDNQFEDEREVLATDTPRQDPPAPKISMATPSDLLKQMSERGDEKDGAFVVASARPQHSKSKKERDPPEEPSAPAQKNKLIEIIEPMSERESQCLSLSQTQAPKPRDKAPVVKRGFLNTSKKPLYPNGSCEGKPASAYVNLLSRSKVIDLAAEQSKEKVVHGESHRHNESSAGPSQNGQKEIDHVDFEFEQLCMEADPELAPLRTRQAEANAAGVFGDQLGRFAKLLSPQS